MLSLNEFISKYDPKQYVSLEGIDTELVEKLSNIDGKQINECCGCCCGNELKCCEPNDPQRIVYYYSEEEIVRMLQTQPKVSNLGDLHRQFSAYQFYAHDRNEGPKPQEPLFFREKINSCSQPIIVGVHDDWAVRNFVMSIPSNDAVVLYNVRENGIQVFYVYYPESSAAAGVNLADGVVPDIKKSLIGAAKTIQQLEKKNEVSWAQVLDVSIDNLDARYAFLITYTLKPELFAQAPIQPEIQAAQAAQAAI